MQHDTIITGKQSHLMQLKCEVGFQVRFLSKHLGGTNEGQASTKSFNPEISKLANIEIERLLRYKLPTVASREKKQDNHYVVI